MAEVFANLPKCPTRGLPERAQQAHRAERPAITVRNGSQCSAFSKEQNVQGCTFVSFPHDNEEEIQYTEISTGEW